MPEQVRDALFQSFQILGLELLLVESAVHLESADGGYDDYRVGYQSGHAAFDVQELLRAEVSAETGLSDGVLAEPEGHLGGHYGVAAVGYVREGSAVHERGGPFQCLYEVGLDGVLEEGCHSAGGLEVVGRNGLSVCVVRDDDASETLLEVGDGCGQAEHSHDLAGDRDVISVLPGEAVGSAAESVNDIAQLSVVHVDAAPPGDASGIDVERVALMNVVVQHRGKEVVRSADGVEVSGEVQVDVLHGDDLGVSAACCAALDAEYRSEGGLAQSNDGFLAYMAQSVCESDSSGGLAFAGRSGGDGGDQHKLAFFVFRFLEKDRIYLCLVAPVLLEIFLVDAGLRGDLLYRAELTFLSDLNVCLVSHCAPRNRIVS